MKKLIDSEIVGTIVAVTFTAFMITSIVMAFALPIVGVVWLVRHM